MTNKVLVTLLSVTVALVMVITGVAVVVYNDRYQPAGNSSVISDISSIISSDNSSNLSSNESSSEVSSSEVSSTKPAPNPDEIKPGEKYYNIYNAVKNLNNSRHGYGFGYDTNAQNRPLLAISQQNELGKYGMNAITKESGHIYLTFDEGWEAGFSGKILDVLKEKNVKATFFVTMSYVKGNQALIRRMIDEGHIIGNHSVTHPDMTTISIKKSINEIMDLHNYMVENYNYEMHLFRPPTGAYSVRSLEIARLLGYRTVEWSFAYNDWDTNAQPDKTVAYQQITNKTHGGAIYLLHAVSKTNTEILGDVIDYWTNAGYDIGPFPNIAPDQELPEVKPAPTPPAPPESSDNSSSDTSSENIEE